MKTIQSDYEAIADVLTLRFKKIIEDNPDLVTQTDPFIFFKHGLKVDDLQPSLFQAQWSLAKAKSLLTPQD